MQRGVSHRIRRLRAVARAWFAGTLRHHAVSLVTTLTSGIRWWWRTNGFGG
jgi:hypothetical protein